MNSDFKDLLRFCVEQTAGRPQDLADLDELRRAPGD
jgi:hypothetical protein